MHSGGIDFFVTIQGSLRSLSIPDLFSLLNQHKKTGLLSLVSKLDERGILFSKGNLVYATACDGSRRLGNILVKLGLLTEQEIDVQTHRGWEPGYFGQELLTRGLITESELNSAVREQILDILDEVLLWEEGAFHFDEWSDGLPENIPSGPCVAAQSIVLDAIRRFDECSLIRNKFPDLSAHLKPSPRPPGGPAETELNDADRETLALVNARRTVAQILRDSDRSPYETSVILAKLAQVGFIQQASSRSSNEDLPSIAEPWSLPASPDLPRKTSWILRENAMHSDRLLEAVASEPAIAAKALRSLAAARLDLSRGEVSLARVLEKLGVLRTHALVVPEMTRGMFFPEKDFFWKACRDHSVVCAHLCQELANWIQFPSPGEAYLAGLLHNLGVFILIGAYPERYRGVLEEARRSRRDLRALEEVTFGMSHVKIGGIYAERWSFPKPLVSVIRMHHQIGEGEGGPLLDLVALANWIARTYEVGLEFSHNAGVQIEGALSRLKLKKQNVLALSENTARAALATS